MLFPVYVSGITFYQITVIFFLLTPLPSALYILTRSFITFFFDCLTLSSLWLNFPSRLTSFGYTSLDNNILFNSLYGFDENFCWPIYFCTTLITLIVLKLSSLENRWLTANQLYLLNLLYGKIDSSRLIERINLHVPKFHIKSRVTFRHFTFLSNKFFKEWSLR